MKLKELLTNKRSALLAGIVAGMTAPASVYFSSGYPKLSGTNTERLREDVERVSQDFMTVISQENGTLKTG